VDLFGRIGRGFRGVEAVDLEELPAAGIDQDQADVSRLLVCHNVQIVARLDGDLQARLPLTGGRRWGGSRNGGQTLLLATAAEAEEKEQDEAGAPD
jgi:hypothetical protein